uniref:Uncharacterized protein n=1 Tax=Setaria italica TaxID=4555 RepID=K3YKG9_SETIT
MYNYSTYSSVTNKVPAIGMGYRESPECSLPARHSSVPTMARSCQEHVKESHSPKTHSRVFKESHHQNHGKCSFITQKNVYGYMSGGLARGL